MGLFSIKNLTNFKITFFYLTIFKKIFKLNILKQIIMGIASTKGTTSEKKKKIPSSWELILPGSDPVNPKD